MQLLRTSLIALLLMAAFIPAAQAQGIQIMDYAGFGWETGGILPSDPGDILNFVATAGVIDPIVGVDTALEEITFYIYDLESVSSAPWGGGTLINYSGGVLEVYRDAAKNANYGTFPPNASAPSTFMDGTLLLRGNFTSFQVFLAADGSGSFGGPADGVAGEMISVCTGCIYTWGGGFTALSQAQMPDGYDLQLDGVLELDPTVPTQDRAWGSLKAHYGQN